MATREAVYQALFALVAPLLAPGGFSSPFVPEGSTAPVTTSSKPFATISREIVEVQRIDPAAQPVLMMYEMDENFQDHGDGLIKQVWTVIFIFGVTSTQGTPGQTILNPLIEAVVAALRPSIPDENQTLGNLVESVKIAGVAGKDHGNNSTAEMRQASYYLPVKITLPL